MVGYFSDGLAEEVINTWSRMDGLRVAARTSVFAFKGKNEDLRGVGQKLLAHAPFEHGAHTKGRPIVSWFPEERAVQPRESSAAMCNFRVRVDQACPRIR